MILQLKMCKLNQIKLTILLRHLIRNHLKQQLKLLQNKLRKHLLHHQKINLQNLILPLKRKHQKNQLQLKPNNPNQKVRHQKHKFQMLKLQTKSFLKIHLLRQIHLQTLEYKLLKMTSKQPEKSSLSYRQIWKQI